ncbi:MAG: hypothetical protein PHH14_04280 [Candidatus Margulisbacteria bacterium]|nr:hypothetical protein [Candidatus Margulisiibacteriota bacterium]
MLLSFDGKVYLAQAGTASSVAVGSAGIDTATKIANPAQADAAFFALLDQAEGMTSEYKKAPFLKSIIEQLPLSNATSQNMKKMFLELILPMVTNLNNKTARTACLSAIFNTLKYDQIKAKASFQIIKPEILMALIEAASVFINTENNAKNDEDAAAAILGTAITNLANAGLSNSNTSPYLRQILNKAKTLKDPTLKNELFTTCYKKISLTIKQPADRKDLFVAEGLGDTYQKLLKGQKLD